MTKSGGFFNSCSSSGAEKECKESDRTAIRVTLAFAKLHQVQPTELFLQ